MRESKKDVADRFGVIPEVVAFARSNVNIKIAKKLAARWGLLDSAEGRDGSGRDGGAKKNWEVTHTVFDPDMGMGMGEEKGGFKAKCGGRGSPFPVQMLTLAFTRENEHEENKFKVSPDLWKKYEECVKNAWKWFEAE